MNYLHLILYDIDLYYIIQQFLTDVFFTQKQIIVYVHMYI